MLILYLLTHHIICLMAALLVMRGEESERHIRAEAMLTGAEYNGYQVSFTADDGNGLLQVKAAFETGLTDTVIHFENGTKMPITAAGFPEFAAWFVAERNKFFVGY